MSTREALRAVRWLASLSDPEIEAVAQAATRVSFRPGQPIVAELEAGDDLFILVEGTARVTVAAGGQDRREVGVLSAGEACGEISLLTRELRSATVAAVTDVVALRLDRATVEALLARHPAIAVHFARAIGDRLAETTSALDAIVADPAGKGTRAVDALAGRSAAVVPSKASLRRAWRELVVAQRRELPTLALVAFVGTSLALRGLFHWLHQGGAELFLFLRAAYTSGIVLVFVSTALSLARFRGSVQRAVAVTFGVGFALILNELSVFLAFDTFYLDMTTRDPDMLFNVESLYRRSESEWAVALMIAFLVQLTLLRRFWRRTLFLARTKLSRAVSRG